MGLRTKILLAVLWKKWISLASILVLTIIFCESFIYVYSTVYVDITKNRGIKFTTERKYDGFKEINEIDGLTKTLMRISQNTRKTVLVSVVNRGYIDLTYNWLCNTRQWNIHSRVLFIVFDKQTEAALKKDWPEVTPFYYTGINETEGFSFATVGYVRIVLKRVKIMMQILENDIKMFVFETDSVWFRNPMAFLDKVTKGHDIAITKMTPLYYDAVGYCICFLYIYPTKVMKTFWRKMYSKMTIELERIKSLEATSLVDNYSALSMQKVFSDLINQGYGGVNYLVLPEELFPDGYFYMAKANVTSQTHAFLLHNNYIVGTNKKIQRAKEAGHWFLRDGMKCGNNIILTESGVQ